MTTRQGVQNTVIYDLDKVRERYDLRPDQMVDFKALKGDSTDNIPGVPGVGEKTAAKLIGQFGTLDALYDRLDEVTPPKLREPLARGEGPRPRQPRADADRARRAGDASTSTRRSSTTTTARRSSGSSASTSSGR